MSHWKYPLSFRAASEVCQFYAVIDDTLTAQYERRPVTIFYYLADDTVEIREQSLRMSNAAAESTNFPSQLQLQPGPPERHDPRFVVASCASCVRYPLNCGRDNFPRLFKRGKLEKAGVIVLKKTAEPARGTFAVA